MQQQTDCFPTLLWSCNFVYKCLFCLKKVRKKNLEKKINVQKIFYLLNYTTSRFTWNLLGPSAQYICLGFMYLFFFSSTTIEAGNLQNEAKNIICLKNQHRFYLNMGRPGIPSTTVDRNIYRWGWTDGWTQPSRATGFRVNILV